MDKTVERVMTLEEYGRQVAHDKARRASVARDLFLLAILFLVAGGAAYYYSFPVVAVGLFVVFLVVQTVASETRLEIAMLDANRALALLVNQQSRDIAQLRKELQQEQHRPTR
ncbi:MAG: hypothetical protein KBF63_15625 [Rhodoferax sp.]|jgi:hypothetical protein|nr:hypothetical protein [Rhodoferax sp.]MBP9930708.1 hypothetical protein [Rhodoferax sp.]HQX59510.1 hypothetical protein [Burkholderiaceae bacterium]HQZ04373.1 hypothetical protein [Burkholderiaceae bacterium]